MSKIFYIIPGFGENENSRKGYKEISKFLTEKGLDNKILNVTWKNRVMSDYVKEVLSQVDQTKEIYFMGFSYGAFISFLLSTKINVKMQILFSLSPCFKEDLDGLKDQWKNFIGKNRIADFSKISFNELALLVKCHTLIMVGEKEHIVCINRAKDANKRIKNSNIIIVPEGKHNIDGENYLSSIKKLLSEIS